MKIHAVTQGSAAWRELRAGIPTASEFDNLLTPTGKPSKSFDRYLHELLAERIMGRPRAEIITLAMERGSAMEEHARVFYEFTRDVKVDQVGFITNGAETVGASPDGLVGAEGLVEFKCPSEHVHVAYLLSETGDGVDKEYRVQIQGQLWITGRQWVDIVSYHPEMPEACHRVERDEEFIALLDARVMEFSRVLENRTLELIERGLIRPKEQKQPETGPEWIGDAEMKWANERTYENG